MNKKEIKEKINEGYIHFNSIIELVGKPKKHVEKTIKTYVEQIEKNENYILVSKDFADVEKTDDKLFSTYVEIEVLTKEIQGVFAFCFNIMPASIEILEPKEAVFNNVKLTDVLNELQAKLHEVDMVAKTTNQKNVHLNENINAIVTNFVVFVCIAPRSIEDIAKITGLKAEVLQPFLENMVANGKLKKDKDKYSIK